MLFRSEEFQREGFRDAWLVAPRFLSTIRQDVMVQQLLPLPVPQERTMQQLTDLVIEPSMAALLQQVASIWLRSVCVEAFWSARRADCAARALHIEAARQELAKRTRRIQYEFFKTLHERLDVMVRETCVVQRHAARRRLPVAAGLTKG